MKEKEQDREKDRQSSPFKNERDDKDHGQPKDKRPPPDLANFERSDDPPPLDHDSNADVEERDIGVEQFSMPKSLISSQLDEKLSRPTSLSSRDGRVQLPDIEGDIMQAVEMSTTDLSGSREQFSMPKSLISSQLDEKLSQPTSLSSKDGRVQLPDVEGDIMQAVEMSTTDLLGSREQFSMPKSLISSQLDEKLSQPTSLSSSKDGRVSFPPLPDVERGIMQAEEMPNTDLSGGEQFSMPKSLSSQLDRISVKRVSRRPLNCYKLTRSKGRQYGRELQKLRREVASLKAKRERNTSAGLDGGNAHKRDTTPWQIFIPVYDDLKMMLRDFTRVYLPQMTCWSITIAVGYICCRSDF